MVIIEDSWSLLLQLITLSRALKYTTHQHNGISIMNQHTLHSTRLISWHNILQLKNLTPLSSGLQPSEHNPPTYSWQDSCNK